MDSSVIPPFSIPVERKDEFSCPKDHVGAFERALPFVKKIVCIGWRATELDFLAILGKGLTTYPELLIISGDQRGANETLENLKGAGIHPVNAALVPNGFTGLINDLGIMDRFLV